MKIILLVCFLYSISFGQGWNTPIETDIFEPYLEKMDLFTNVSGNHILIKRSSGDIVYYRLDSQGELETSSNPNPFSNDGDFPNITGSNNTVFAFWKETSSIKGKYSTDGGNNWFDLPER